MTFDIDINSANKAKAELSNPDHIIFDRSQAKRKTLIMR